MGCGGVPFTPGGLHDHTRKLRSHHTEDRRDASRATGGAFEISPFDCRNTHARASNPVQRTARIQSRRRPHAAPSSNASVTAGLQPDANVRFGSKADICGATSHVRFTPDSDRESGFPRKVMSALLPKADMCGAASDVRFGPIADIDPIFHLTAKKRPPWWRSLRNLVKRFLGGSSLSVRLQEGQQVGIYRACLGGRAAVRKVLVGL